MVLGKKINYPQMSNLLKFWSRRLTSVNDCFSFNINTLKLLILLFWTIFPNSSIYFIFFHFWHNLHIFYDFALRDTYKYLHKHLLLFGYLHVPLMPAILAIQHQLQCTLLHKYVAVNPNVWIYCVIQTFIKSKPFW